MAKLQDNLEKVSKPDHRTMSIRMLQSQQLMLRRESKRRGLRIRDLIMKAVRFYIKQDEVT